MLHQREQFIAQPDACLFCLAPCLLAGDVDFTDKLGGVFPTWHKGCIKTEREDIGRTVFSQELTVEPMDIPIVDKDDINFTLRRLFSQRSADTPNQLLNLLLEKSVLRPEYLNL